MKSLLLLLLTVAPLAATALCPFSGKSDGPCRGLRVQAEAPKPDPGQGTVRGCKCKTACGAVIGDAFDCDICDTEKNADGSDCGIKVLFTGGHYDYCVYPEVEEYEKKTAAEKTAFLLGKITEDTEGYKVYPSGLNIFKESIQTSFARFSDELPNGRVKDIHGIGVVCPFEFNVAADSPYTGLFEPGMKNGFVRMGSAADPVENKGQTPGVGVKFTRTGVHSGNFVALHSVALGQSYNFFAYNISNHVPAAAELATKAVAKKFQQGTQCVSQVGLSDMARWSQDGTQHAKPVTPFKLFMIPSDEVQTPATPKTAAQTSAEMEAFPVGTTIYTVYACAEAAGVEAEMHPTDGGLAVCAKPTKLGAYVLTGKCTTSKFGDEKLFFRHQRIEDDWALYPEFLEQYDAAGACGWSGKISAHGAPKTCAEKNPAASRSSFGDFAAPWGGIAAAAKELFAPNLHVHDEPVEMATIMIGDQQCQAPGDCGFAYKACCAASRKKGHSCDCHLQDASPGGNVPPSTCGNCGVVYAACCAGFKNKGFPCTCDVSLPPAPTPAPTTTSAPSA